MIGLAALVASVWFSLAQGVKRLHDLNKSGWLILLMFIPIVNAIFGLYMLFADGTVGPNQYGADPKNRMPYQGQPSAVNVTVNVSREDVKVENRLKLLLHLLKLLQKKKRNNLFEQIIKTSCEIRFTGGFLFMFRFLISMREIYLYWKSQNKRDGWIY